MVQDHFDGPVAADYDRDEAEAFTPDVLDPAVDVLAELADGGRALEFAIGTGRVALPLAARGVEVAGIELSTAMVEQLRAKPGGGDLEVVIGDMASARVPGRFDLVYLVFNTIMNLTTLEAQVDCVANAAAHLRPGGRFVVEVMVPNLRWMAPDSDTVAFAVDDDHIGFDHHVDPATQRLDSHHLHRVGDTFVERVLPCRYVWPSELDLMARLAGMTPEARWEDWHRAPFTGQSRSHVSVWRARP